MKTKEIACWVHKDINFRSTVGPTIFLEKNEMHGFNVKAKLIVELPEKSVTITESEFDEIVHAHDMTLYENVTPNSLYKHLKKKIFGSDN